MLSHVFTAEVAVPAHVLPRMGALPACGDVAVPRHRADSAFAPAMPGLAAASMAAPRPQVRGEAGGSGAPATGLAKLARQQRTSSKYATTTRVAAFGGGASGPHPARDPV